MIWIFASIYLRLFHPSMCKKCKRYHCLVGNVEPMLVRLHGRPISEERIGLNCRRRIARSIEQAIVYAYGSLGE